MALLQLDIANAFNSCDRARLLRELYAVPELQPVYRIADPAYTQPSSPVLSGCDGRMIESAQGVRQGGPLSALLFCVYKKQLLEQVSDNMDVTEYGFFDDVNLLDIIRLLLTLNLLTVFRGLLLTLSADASDAVSRAGLWQMEQLLG